MPPLCSHITLCCMRHARCRLGLGRRMCIMAVRQGAGELLPELKWPPLRHTHAHRRGEALAPWQARLAHPLCMFVVQHCCIFIVSMIFMMQQ